MNEKDINSLNKVGKECYNNKCVACRKCYAFTFLTSDLTDQECENRCCTCKYELDDPSVFTCSRCYDFDYWEPKVESTKTVAEASANDFKKEMENIISASLLAIDAERKSIDNFDSEIDKYEDTIIKYQEMIKTLCKRIYSCEERIRYYQLKIDYARDALLLLPSEQEGE